jgi:hypothetical protein
MQLAVTFKDLFLWEFSGTDKACSACAQRHNDVCTVVSGQVKADGSKGR